MGAQVEMYNRLQASRPKSFLPGVALTPVWVAGCVASSLLHREETKNLGLGVHLASK